MPKQKPIRDLLLSPNASSRLNTLLDTYMHENSINLTRKMNNKEKLAFVFKKCNNTQQQSINDELMTSNLKIGVTGNRAILTPVSPKTNSLAPPQEKKTVSAKTLLKISAGSIIAKDALLFITKYSLNSEVNILESATNELKTHFFNLLTSSASVASGVGSAIYTLILWSCASAFAYYLYKAVVHIKKTGEENQAKNNISEINKSLKQIVTKMDTVVDLMREQKTRKEITDVTTQLNNQINAQTRALDLSPPTAPTVVTTPVITPITTTPIVARPIRTADEIRASLTAQLLAIRN